jgi:GH15 family glucan-1,4-alpha-glucosidase
MVDLVHHSLEVIRRWQQPGGAYPACPTMPDYQYCWFRDGSFTAYAMALYGEMESAHRFHEWSARVILQYAEGARRAMSDFAVGQTPDKHGILRARYTYEGGKGPDDWPEFQLDGLGTWLWALDTFQTSGQSLSASVCEAARLTADYLMSLWSSPCHDLWEEAGDHVHTYTLAAIYAGLKAAGHFLQIPDYGEMASTIKAFMLAECADPQQGFFKSVLLNESDGSLVAVAFPYAVLPLDHPLIRATLKRIEGELYVTGRGVHRYRRDSYYGGGTWLLLSAWLGWVYAKCGETDRARAILDELSHLATADGDLPEQVVPPMLTSAPDYEYWVRVRGPIATPLLWSHAMYLILKHEVK